MNRDVDDNTPNIAAEHGHLEQREEVVALQDCNFFLWLSHIAILFVYEVDIWVQDITSLYVKLLQGCEDFDAAKQ